MCVPYCHLDGNGKDFPNYTCVRVCVCVCRCSYVCQRTVRQNKFNFHRNILKYIYAYSCTFG